MERFFFALNGKAIYFEGLAGQILLHLRNENCARSHIGASRKASDEALADQKTCLKRAAKAARVAKAGNLQGPIVERARGSEEGAPHIQAFGGSDLQLLTGRQLAP